MILHLLSAVFDLTYLSRLRRGYGTVGSESVPSVGLDVTCFSTICLLRDSQLGSARFEIFPFCLGPDRIRERMANFPDWKQFLLTTFNHLHRQKI